jgi:outer membrane lipoprotein-sorting protein
MMSIVKRIWLSCSLLLLAAFWMQGQAMALTADEILTLSRDRPDGKDIFSEAKLILTDEQGRSRVRDLLYLQKDYGRDEKLSLYFSAPADVNGVAFQSATYEEAKGQDDDQWLYMPAFRQVRRIATANKRGSFMGSEFTFLDMEKLRVSDYTQTLVGEETVAGRPCHVIERKPVSQAIIAKTGYYKTVVWVDTENYIVLKQDYFDAKNVLFKTMTVKQLDNIQGIWTVMRSDMDDLVNKKSSSLVFANVRYDVGLDDDLFTTNAMKRGVRRDNISALR